jgi:glycosyltransferase involved in cell wall biosynthesis
MGVKVAVFGHSSGLAGAELSLFFCVKRMVAEGMQVHVFLPRPGPLAEKLLEFQGDIEIEYLPLRWWMGKRQRHIIGFIRTVQSLWDTLGVLVLLKKLQPEVVLTISSVTPAPLIASKILKIPNVLTLGESLKSNPTLKSFLPKKLIALLIHKCSDRVLSCSKFVADQYGLKSEIAYPEIEEFYVRKPTQRALTNPHMVMLGSYSFEKGQDLAIEVARHLLDEDFKFNLVFYGWGDEKLLLKLERKVIHYGLGSQVTFMPQTKNVLDVLSKATLSLVFSKNEAFGKVTLESLSQGTPVIGVDAGGTSEILNQGGGLLVPPEPNLIAQTIVDLLNSPQAFGELQQSAISNPILYQITGTRRDICSHINELATVAK